TTVTERVDQPRTIWIPVYERDVEVVDMSEENKRHSVSGTESLVHKSCHLIVRCHSIQKILRGLEPDSHRDEVSRIERIGANAEHQEGNSSGGGHLTSRGPLPRNPERCNRQHKSRWVDRQQKLCPP